MMRGLITFIFLLNFAHTLIASTALGQGAESSNPAIGLNALFLYEQSSTGNRGDSDEGVNGFSLQELELQFLSDIDPYWRAVALIGLAQEEGEYHIEPEELYAESLSMPYVTIKAGKFLANIGKYNTYHPHNFPFIDAALINQQLFGDEGLAEAGLSAMYLLPTNWYSEVTLQALQGEHELFASSSNNDVAGLMNWKNLWDISSSTTMEWGVSGAFGENADERQTRIAGTDLTFKWRPTAGGKYNAIVWSSEWLKAEVGAPGGEEITQGFVSFVQWQMARRWWVQARAERVLEQSAAGMGEQKTQKQSVLLGFFASEFSGFRLQYDRTKLDEQEDEHKVALQFNFSIGAHPAHTY